MGSPVGDSWAVSVVSMIWRSPLTASLSARREEGVVDGVA